MKIQHRALALLLCLCMLLFAGCSSDEQPQESTVPTQAPTTVQDVVTQYADAMQALEQAKSLTYTLRFSAQRVIGGETYLELNEGTVAYGHRGSKNFAAQVDLDLTYGTYKTHYTEDYTNGKAYASVMDSAFAAEMSQKEFEARQIPALLITPGLYKTVTAEQTADGITLTFTAPTELEAWAADCIHSQLVDATGTVTLDPQGHIKNTTYSAQYVCGPASYTLDVTTQPTLSASFTPEVPEQPVTLAWFDAPKAILQVVGDVYTAQSITASYTDSIYNEVLATYRVQSSAFDVYGNGNRFIARQEHQVNVTDYANTPTSNTQVFTFLDGTCTSTVNGGEPTNVAGMTAEQMRISCEDAVLNPVMALNFITGAEMTATGDVICIKLTGSEEFARNLSTRIFQLFQMLDPESYSGCTTNLSEGYLTIDRHTGLPTSMGIAIERSYVIDSITYQLRYKLDQSVVLSSLTSFETITGEPEKSDAFCTPLLYKVTGSEGQTMWLMGTIHAGDSRTGDLPDTITDALSVSDALAVEFDPQAFETAVNQDPALLAQLTKTYYYADGTTVRDHISPDLYEKLQPLMQAMGLSSDAARFRTILLWDLVGEYYLRQGYTIQPNRGADLQLITLAKAQEKPILELESGLGQMQMLSSLSDALQEALLKDTLDAGLLTYCAETARLYDLWCQGDEKALTEAVFASRLEDEALYAEYVKAMYTDRNAKMLEAATGYLNGEQTVFYAVGIAHVLGENGLVAQLQAAGYSVEAVKY